MKQVIILQGLPASGKSTWAREHVAQHPNRYKRINKDELRTMLDAGKFSSGNEDFVLAARDALILLALREGKHVIVDDTNLHPKHETQIRSLVSSHNKATGDSVSVSVKFFPINLEDAIRRDLQRPQSVGERVIRKMYDEFLKPKSVLLAQDQSLPHAIIVDIDGTVALKGERSPFDWANVHQDTPNEPIVRMVESLAVAADVVWLFISGRDEICRDATTTWLQQHMPIASGKSTTASDIMLWMRPVGDVRKDAVVKREIYDNHIAGKYYVRFVLDDRNQVVEMWRELGLTCLQVADGDF